MEYLTVSLAPSLLSDVMAFLYLYEHTCVNLIDNLIEKGEPYVPDKADCRVFYADSGTATEICGVIMLLKSGLLLHCIPFDTPYRKQPQYHDFLKKEITSMLNNRQLFCIMGEGEVSELIMGEYKKISNGNLNTKPSVVRQYELRIYDPVWDRVEETSYILMNDGYKSELALKAANDDLLPIVPCTLRDVNALMPLQKSYELVEVLPPGQDYSERISRLNLVRTMTRYPVFGVPDKKGLNDEGLLSFIAKAGINAVGRRVMQIGGVFTEPEYRGQGIARRLVSMMGRLYSQQRKRVVLFVDVKNLPARRAYDYAGFTLVSSYNIIYY